MAHKTRAVTVPATAGGIVINTVTPTDSVSGSSLALYNNSVVTMYQGGPDVTTANGVPIPAGSWGPGVDIQPGEAAHAIVASGTAEARVLETGI